MDLTINEEERAALIKLLAEATKWKDCDVCDTLIYKLTTGKYTPPQPKARVQRVTDQNTVPLGTAEGTKIMIDAFKQWSESVWYIPSSTIGAL